MISCGCVSCLLFEPRGMQVGMPART
jgi:hypothetical protein